MTRALVFSDRFRAPTSTLRLRLECDDDEIRPVVIDVSLLDGSPDEIRFCGNTIGFISHDDYSFTAFIGPAWTQARACGRFQLWDEAAAQIVKALGIQLTSSLR